MRGQRGERSEIAAWPASWSQSSNGTACMPDLSYWGVAGRGREVSHPLRLRCNQGASSDSPRQWTNVEILCLQGPLPRLWRFSEWLAFAPPVRTSTMRAWSTPCPFDTPNPRMNTGLPVSFVECRISNCPFSFSSWRLRSTLRISQARLISAGGRPSARWFWCRASGVVGPKSQINIWA